jgi:hypothetical protein
MDISVAAPIDVESDSDNSKEMEEEVQKSQQGNSSTVDCRVSSMSWNLPDPNKFPLLHSLCVCNNTHMDNLLQEIVQLYGNQSICFTHGNNQKGTLVIVPSDRTLEHYKEELSKPRSVVDAILECIVESKNSTAENAASCLLSVLFSKLKESFISVCIEKSLIDGNVDKKMDFIATEAMLQEANINNTNARILFCHLRQFFGGRSYFESEQKRRSFFWFKRPDQLLQSQLPKLIDISKLKDLMHADIIVGDHGGGKFRMMLKVNFHLQDKSTVSFLTQIASVSFSKEGTEILNKLS